MAGTLFITILFGKLVLSSGQISFPANTHIETPEPCPDEEEFCGNEPEKYPTEKINKIVMDSKAFHVSPETRDRFFGSKASSNFESGRGLSDEFLKPSCSVRTEFIPRYARAKNVLGNWVYIVQASDVFKQNVEISICESINKPCRNDYDSPFGEETTVCKQLYRTEKLLAVNETGDMVVDTFRVPSACSCNYRGQFGFGLRRIGSESSGKLAPQCTKSIATQSISIQGDRVSQREVRRLRLNEPIENISPCGNNDVICENNKETYPEKLIQDMLSSNEIFSSSKYFDAIFGDLCIPSEDLNSIGLREGFNFEATELCTSFQKYVYPTKAKNIFGDWRYIINTDQYKQGVTIELCLPTSENASCLYGGAEGNNPSWTICKQEFAVHRMLAVKPDGSVSYEPFSIPSSCSCYFKDFFAT